MEFHPSQIFHTADASVVSEIYFRIQTFIQKRTICRIWTITTFGKETEKLQKLHVSKYFQEFKGITLLPLIDKQ